MGMPVAGCLQDFQLVIRAGEKLQLTAQPGKIGASWTMKGVMVITFSTAVMKDGEELNDARIGTSIGSQF